MTYQNIARLIPTIQAASLAGHNLKVVNKKNTSAKDIMGLGVTNIIGTSLIKTTADLVEL